MRILVTGSNGRLGRAFQQLVRSSSFPTDHELIFAAHDTLDIRKPAHVRGVVAGARPEAIVNCAAYTDVDRAEMEKAMAWAVNVEGPATLAAAARDVGAKLVQISSDFVFDGEKPAPYGEHDETNPLNHYGRSKLAGEFRVLFTSADNLVVRVAWLYGDGDPSPRAPIEGDRISSPAFAPDVAGAILRLIGVGAKGVVHFANRGVAGRAVGYGVAPAVRPRYSVLDTSLYTHLTGDVPRAWQETVMEKAS